MHLVSQLPLTTSGNSGGKMWRQTVFRWTLFRGAISHHMMQRHVASANAYAVFHWPRKLLFTSFPVSFKEDSKYLHKLYIANTRDPKRYRTCVLQRQRLTATPYRCSCQNGLQSLFNTLYSLSYICLLSC